jgi:L-erythro-3,5-diaminohexanoate dehydrogenase
VSPSVGSPSGDHRVLEPPGATTATARRVDALGELWDGEVRIDLEALVLDPGDLARWRSRFGADATALAASLVETVAERGALDGEAGRGTYVGTVACVGRAHPWPAVVGERVALPLPALAVPAFAVPGPWDGRSPVVPVQGHAIAPAGVPTVALPDDASGTGARWLAQLADVPAALDAFRASAPEDAIVVLGGDTEPGAVAVAQLVAQGAETGAVVETLEGARIAEALGAEHVVVADLADPPGTARVIADDVPATFGAAVVAAPHAGPLAVRVASRILLASDLDSASSLAHHATAAARSVEIVVRRDPGVERGTRVRDLVASSRALADVLRWRTGPPVPRGTGRELPPWERP